MGTKKNSSDPVLCVYCDAEPSATMDHVVPKSLFPRPLPAEMVTVPACQRCNNEKSRDDDYLRDMLVIDIENTLHPVAQRLLAGEMSRSARRNRSLIARDIASKGAIRPMHSMGGIFLGQFPCVPLDEVRVNRLFARITRGLYYKVSGCRRLPQNCEFEVRRVDRFRLRQAVDLLVRLGCRARRDLGNVFGCMQVIAAEDPSVTHWLQWYYNVFITVSTNLSKVSLYAN